MNRHFVSMVTIAAAAAAAASAASAEAVKQITIEAGKGVSFQLGRQNGIALFTQDAGACGLSVSISPMVAQDSMSGMSGMGGGTAGAAANIAPTMKVQVLPARPARLSTPDGQELVFNCGPDAKQMFLDMPGDFKYSSK